MDKQQLVKQRMQEMEQRRTNWSTGKWLESTIFSNSENQTAHLHNLFSSTNQDDQSEQQEKQQQIKNDEEEWQCGICFEWMESVEHAPILLFPCGHTFCKQCVQKLLRKRVCPNCRGYIEQQAPNIELQKMIQFHKEQITKLQQQKQKQMNTAAPNLQQLQIRKQVLLSELEHLEEEQQHVLQQQNLAQEFLTQLHAKQQTVTQQLIQLQQQQRQIQQDISSVSLQESSLQKQFLQMKQRTEYIYSTLDYLQVQIQKSELIKITKRQ